MKFLLSSVLMLSFFLPAKAQRKYNNTGNAPLQLYMVQVGGGSFDLGSDDEATDRRPAHSVTLKDFSIGTYEITQDQWKLVMGSNPSSYICEECPVTNVSYKDVMAFIEKLNSMTGKHYRLPTEAEWEYAARGGQMERLIKSPQHIAPGGVNEFLVSEHNTRVPDKVVTGKKYAGKRVPQDVAWFARNSRDHIHPIGRKKPNELGIYDMSGNVEEWCADFYAKDYGSRNSVDNPKGPAGGNAHVVRGGSWNSSTAEIAVTRRAGYLPDTKSNSLGFRVVADAEDKQKQAY
jgi:formylglycine-generating enzyme required for sulfatase activity